VSSDSGAALVILYLTERRLHGEGSDQSGAKEDEDAEGCDDLESY
jgi:hypothetical protein